MTTKVSDLKHLSDQQRKILSLLVEYKRLNSRNFYDLVGNPHENSVRRTLQDLTADHFIARSKRFYEDDTDAQYRHSKLLYWLTPKGLRLVQYHGLDPNNEAKASERLHLIEHENGITQFHIALKRFCDENGLELYWRQKKLKCTVNPDALFAITDPKLPEGENTLYFFLEYENSDPFNDYDKEGDYKILRNLKRYYTYQKTQLCLQEWGDFNAFIVVTLLRDEAWMPRIVKDLAPIANEHIKVATLEAACLDPLGLALKLNDGTSRVKPREIAAPASLTGSPRPEAAGSAI